jgi:hypothetical protein
MRLGVLLLVFFPTALSLHGQRPFESNLWSSFVLNIKQNDWGIVTDLGYRLCDSFINQRRTALARITVDRSLIKNHRLGLGYAYFEHYGGVTSRENRLFLQYSTAFTFQDSKLNFRFRNELRTFNNRNTTNRMRLQVAYFRDLSPLFGAQTSAEIFYTPGNNSLVEQRYLTGINTRISEQVKLVCYYMGQIQSNVKYLQNMIGIQLQVILERSSSLKRTI